MTGEDSTSHLLFLQQFRNMEVGLHDSIITTIQLFPFNSRLQPATPLCPKNVDKTTIEYSHTGSNGVANSKQMGLEQHICILPNANANAVQSTNYPGMSLKLPIQMMPHLDLLLHGRCGAKRAAMQ
jgi:hypothetical protein